MLDARTAPTTFQRFCRFRRFVAGSADLVILLCLAALLGVAPLLVAQSSQPSQPVPSPSKSASPSSQASASSAQPAPGQKTFPSPQDAAEALAKAARDHDESALLIILGPRARDIVIWSPDVGDRTAEDDVFAQKYQQMHRFVREPDSETTLYVGAENWPLPIPLVEQNGKWYFDSALGRQEILYRRIGRNELETVDTLRAIVDAENEYYSESPASSEIHEYARRFESDPNSRDGLYWPSSGSASGGNPSSESNDDDASPIGRYIAQAGYERSERTPLHGYYFRILTAQGPHARGGPLDYMVNGKMTSGFAVVAFPAAYRSSGVETFIVDQDGIVREKDLGPATSKIGASIKTYDPDATWTRVQPVAFAN